MVNKQILLLLTLALVLSGCGSGQPQGSATGQPRDNSPWAEGIPWPEQQILPLPNVDFKLQTKYMNQAMGWVVVASPYKGQLESLVNRCRATNQGGVKIAFYDREDFLLEEIRLNFNQMITTVDQNNSPLLGRWEGSRAMDPGKYAQIKRVNIIWDESLIPE